MEVDWVLDMDSVILGPLIQCPMGATCLIAPILCGALKGTLGMAEVEVVGGEGGNEKS
jgi:hypothetical protein